MPFDEYEAERARSNGTPIGPGRLFTTLAAEASGREAVMLAGRGRYVEFVLKHAANAVTVRYAIPDTADGAGGDASLGLYVDGRRIGGLALTSRYGWFYGAYPFTNRPADGHAHHFYDHARLLLDRVLPSGTHVRFMVGPEDQALWYAIDLADFERVPPPRRQPLRSISVIALGADPRGLRDSTIAFERGVAVAREHRAILWIPPGLFRVTGHLVVDDVTIAGAGLWYAAVKGEGIGIYGASGKGPASRVVLRNFSILGEVAARNDKVALSGIGGAMGHGSLIEDLWIQHENAGLWFDGPMRGLAIRRLRVFDTTADGLNFHRGVSHAIVEDSMFRNTGDDGIASWSEKEANHDITLLRNTVVVPVLANGIAIYGGHDIRVDRNLVTDSVTEGGGIHLGNRFNAVPASGSIRITNNVIIRSGSFDPHWHFGVGALWLYALDAPLDAMVTLDRNAIVDSSEEAIQFLGQPIRHVDMDRIWIEGANGAAIRLQAPGNARMRRVTTRNVRGPVIEDCSGTFRIRHFEGMPIR